MSVSRAEPHCIVWANARASLWGHVKWHHLDEPVMLTEPVSVRLRYRGEREIISDRQLSMKTLHGGTHVALRYYFKDGHFIEQEVKGVFRINAADTFSTAEVSITL